MAKVYFDFGATVNGTGTPNNPKNTISGYTFVAGDEHYFRRGTSYTGAFSTVAGVPGKRTKYKAWYNPDGSDDSSKARPIFTLTTGISTFASPKDNVEIDSLDIRVTFGTVVADTAAVFLGNNSSISNCNIDSNLGAIAAFNRSNVGIYYNTISGVKYTGSSLNNNVVIVSSSLAADSAFIIGNRIYHYSGGGTQSHAIRAEGTATPDLTNLIISDNEISPPDGTSYVTNLNSQGIRMQRCPGAKIMRNKVHGMLSGCFVVGGGTPISVYFGYNDMSDNLNFGIHLTSDTSACIIEYNNCNRNGTNNASASAYGRGIELSSGAGQGRCANHIVRFNVCNNNKNYGGPADNGSEGVGIGLDDGTMGCYVYGNICQDNEGNGIQLYGGNNTTTWTDTGANNVIGNLLVNNCTASLLSRRTGGVAETVFIAHISLASTYGTRSYIANNTFVGGKLGVSITNNCSNYEIDNNLFIGVANGVQFGGTPANCYNNVFYKNTLSSMNNYCTMATTTGAMAFTGLSFTGVSDATYDPKVDMYYRPTVVSPIIGAGKNIGKFQDQVGKLFKTPPCIGMYEWYPSTILPLHI